MVAKHGRGSGGGARGSGGGGSSAAATSPRPAGKRRGAPQTFAHKLHKVLQGAEQDKSSPVSWCLEGKSFTVHNDRDFETKVLTANYRHGKFSSFQRQLNMYGFRKVADCSDRTYSHPFFRRDQPELLTQVRRVVNDPLGLANANANSGGSSVKRSPAAVVAAAAAAAAVPRESEGEEREPKHQNGGKTCDGDNSHRLPVRKKARRCNGNDVSSRGGVGSSSSGSQRRQASAASGGVAAGAASDGSSPRVRGNSGEVFRHPSQQQQQQQQQQQSRADAPTPPDALTQRQHQRCQDPRMPQKLQVQEQHRLQARSCAPAAPAAAASSLNPSRQEFSRMWHKHTGRWSGLNAGDNGVGGSLDDDGRTWTTSSSSAASSSVEDNATSPVLLPITPASLDCSSSCVPPFRLQSEVDPSLADVGRRRDSGGGGGGGSYSQHRSSTTSTGSTIVANNGDVNRNGGNSSNVPALVSPAAGSSSGSTMPVLGGVLEYWRGAGGVATSSSSAVAVAPAAAGTASLPAAATMSTFMRSPSSAMYSGTASKMLAPGHYSGAWRGNMDVLQAGASGGTSGVGDTRGVSASVDEGATLSLDKAFGFGTALARYPSFDLATDRAAAPNGQPAGIAQADNQEKKKDSAADGDNVSNNAVVPVSPTASPYEMATAAATAGDSWDLTCLGGAGWGSPDTTESPAAEVWAAIPPLPVAANVKPGLSSSSPSPSPSSQRPTWGSFGGSGAAVVEGGNGNGSGSGSGSSSMVGGANPHQRQQQQQQQQQQQRQRLKHKEPQQHSRSYSRNNIPGSSGLADSFDWSLFPSNGVEGYTAAASTTTFSSNTYAAQLGFVDETPPFMGVGSDGDNGGGGPTRREPSTGTAGTSGYL